MGSSGSGSGVRVGVKKIEIMLLSQKALICTNEGTLVAPSISQPQSFFHKAGFIWKRYCALSHVSHDPRTDWLLLRCIIYMRSVG